MKKFTALLLAILLVFTLTACGSQNVAGKPYIATIAGEILNGQYTGAMEKNMPNGTGKFTYADNFMIVSYTGGWVNGIPAGEGRLEFTGYRVEANGILYKGKYEGAAVAGIPNGEGRFTAYEGGVFSYSGQWKDGKIAGNGELEVSGFVVNYEEYVATGTYKGAVVDGVPNGTGSFTAGDGELTFSYTGNWSEGAMSGEGTLYTNLYEVTFKDGTVRTGLYSGAVVDGVAVGQGSFTTYDDDKQIYTYEGQWENGLPHGQGRLAWEAPGYYVQEGNFVEGDFLPTPLEYFTARGTRTGNSYIITDKAKDFLTKYPEVFTSNDLSKFDGEVDKNFDYKAFAKNQSTYGDKPITVYGYLVQIIENNYWGADHSFYIIRDRANNYYYAYMYGFAEGIYEGSYVTMTALPLAHFSYESVAGNNVSAVACAGITLK